MYLWQSVRASRVHLLALHLAAALLLALSRDHIAARDTRELAEHELAAGGAQFQATGRTTVRVKEVNASAGNE